MDMIDLFAIAPPGLEHPLLEEVRALGFKGVHAVPGGIAFKGGWPDIWRANLDLRGATRILARLGSFHAGHLSQLDKLSRAFPWGATLPQGVPIRVEVTSHKSKIYHEGAAIERISNALIDAGHPVAKEAPLTLKGRIDNNEVTLSLDTSGESLHKRGHKEAIGKAPLRETLASLFLRQAGFNGAEPLLDPMCGSGTFLIEAAEMALGAQAGRSRSFSFELLPSFDAQAFSDLKRPLSPPEGRPRYFGSDRDAGAARMALANATRAGVAPLCQITQCAVSDVVRPDGPPGLVMANPPYGARIGKKNHLFGLYAALGEKLATEFQGWRVGIVTSEPDLVRATNLPLKAKGKTVAHGGLKIRLYCTGPLGERAL